MQTCSTEDDLVSEVIVVECLDGNDHLVWCAVDAIVGTEVVRPRDQWNPRRTDYTVVICLSCLAL